MFTRPASLRLLILGSVGFMLASMVIAPTAAAATFTVTNNNDSGLGSLEQAVLDANDNNNPGMVDRINFNLPLAGGDTITSDDGLEISEPVAINGCSETPNNAGPCVGFRGLLDDPTDPDAFEVSASNVRIRGFALTNWEVGIRAQSANPTGLRVQNNWFGTKLDEAAEKNAFGLLLSSQDSITVGGRAGATGLAPATRNVFSNNSSAGVRILGNDDTRIQGNWFGVNPEGGTANASGNGYNIVITSDYSGNRPTGTVIGGRATPDEVATAACDGACNVLARAEVNGIDLDPEGGTLTPAGRTVIAGNFVGVFGECDCGNEDIGIHVGESDNVTIGGPSRRDRNVIGYNDTGIRASDGANGLTIQKNLLGIQPLESEFVGAAPDETLAVVMAGGRFLGNRIAGNTAAPTAGGLRLDPGSPSIVRGNRIGVGSGVGPTPLGMPGAGINVVGNGNTIGGKRQGQGNVIGQMYGSFSAAISVNSNGNSILGNFIGTDGDGGDLDNENVGIAINGDGNRVGGGTRGSENVVSNSLYNAIVVVEDGSDNNLIARNRGRENGGLFIELDPVSGPGNDPNTGPNHGVQEPEVTRAKTDRASGTALPGATVRVFLTSEPMGRVDRFLGMTTATGLGRWVLSFGSSLPAGKYLTATQTPNGTRDTSELAPVEIVSE